MSVGAIDLERKFLLHESYSGARTYKVPAVVDNAHRDIIMKEQLAKDSLQSLSRESYFLDMIRAPCIVEKLEYDAAADRLFLAYVEGETVAQYLNRSDRTLEGDLHVAYGMAEALAYVHSAERKPAVVHNDISKDNFIVTAEDDVTLLDFAGSYLLDHIPLSFRRKKLWSGRYCPPEKSAGKLELGRASDVFFLSGILFDVLAPYVTFTDEGTGQLSTQLEDALLRSMNPNYLVRPSAAELADRCNEEMELR